MRIVLCLCALGVLTLGVGGCSDPFEDATCTLESRSFPIQVDRDVAAPFAAASTLKVEACATREGQTPTCAVAAAVASGADFAIGTPSDALEGTLTRATDGTTKLTLTLHVGEGAPGTTTALQVRVLDGSDKEITKAAGAVRWSNESCHPTPDATKI